MGDIDQQPLRAAIVDTLARLRQLDTERNAAEERLTELRAELAKQQGLSESSIQPARQVPRTPSEKVALFRSLFAGRTDVFARRWHNPKRGKQGYAPACNNEWLPGVCEKPRVKCGECPNQAFVPVSDQILAGHLRGRLVAGVYPLLTDETCHFLAVDFDKGNWQQDVAAFVATCRRFDLPAAVERSRSGNGAHVWFFFASPVAAATARKMGCFLITQTMGARHELPMGSYDRLFPNQDTLPKGGFGNLIALPLQRRARDQGNTVFVDDDFAPYRDQWVYLAAVPRIESGRVEALAYEAAETGQVIGVHPVDDEGSNAPWQRSPSRRQGTPTPTTAPLPRQVRIVFAQQLFVDKQDLPPALINRIKRLAAFQNPEFYKKQALRLSTARTPRVISCVEELPQHVGLPRGCFNALQELLSAHGVAAVIKDRRSQGTPLDVVFHGTLTEAQERASRALAAHETGVLVAPPAAGKTVVGIHLITKHARNTLVLVHRTQLIEQWRAQLSVFLDMEPNEIGLIGGGKRRQTGCIDVAMMQSLVRRGEVADLVADYGHVIVDECHHVPAVSFERIMSEVRARYVTGLTATPQRRDGHHPILRFQLGPVRHAVDARRQVARHRFRYRLIVRETGFRATDSETSGIQQIYSRLIVDANRNALIVNDVIAALEEGRSPILLTERREHLEHLAERLRGFARHVVVMRGGMTAKQRRATAEALASIPDDEERLLLATGRFIGEGFDDARLDTLFLALPVSWKGTLVQYAGRLHRNHRGKTEVRIHDYVGREVPVLARMFEKRLKGYRSMGYAAVTAPGFRLV